MKSAVASALPLKKILNNIEVLFYNNGAPEKKK